MEKIRIKRICAAVLSLTMLSGCASGNSNVTESETVTSASEVTTEAVSSETTTTAPAETEPPKKEYDLLNLEKEEMDILAGKLASLPMFSDDLTAEDISIISADTFSISPEKSTEEIYRASTGKMSLSEETDSDFAQSVEAQERLSSLSKFASDRDLSEGNITVTVEISEDLDPDIKNISASYAIKDMAFNGFIRKKNSVFEIIVDPAYMIGIPMTVFSDCTFDINGGVKLDSIGFKADSIYSISFDKSEYAYATIIADYNAIVDMNGTVSSFAMLNSVDVINEDGASKLTAGLDTEAFETKDEASASVFSALKKNMNMFMAEDVTGVKLIDLDFDEFPELLVSKNTVDENYDGWNKGGYDIDIYRISSDESLNYIDTLYNLNTQIYQTGNVIGVKDLGSEGKKWYYMSRYDLNDIGNRTDDAHDYLFTLNGDKLEYTEVFSSKGSDDDDVEKEVYYAYMGSEIVPQVTIDQGPYEEEEWEYYSFNGITATFGKWELFGLLREDYCSDISPVFQLNSDFLFENEGYGGEGNKLSIDERSLEFKLGYLVDSFFYGDYDETEQEYRYEFLGDYAKPVIYLYPEEPTDVDVNVEVKNGAITCSYPEYKDGWKVNAMPDGTLTDSDGNKYYCLYWEAVGDAQWDMSKGFVVKSSDTADFLRKKLLEIGLSEREANEFIIYWLPELTKNPCNLITFQTERYEENTSLNISPAPDSMLRVFMVYRPCSEELEIEPQSFEKFERRGFTAVEWGGARID